MNIQPLSSQDPAGAAPEPANAAQPAAISTTPTPPEPPVVAAAPDTATVASPTPPTTPEPTPVETPKAVAEAIAATTTVPEANTASPTQPAPTAGASIYPAASVGSMGSAASAQAAPDIFSNLREDMADIAAARLAGGIGGAAIVVSSLLAVLVRNSYVALVLCGMVGVGTVMMAMRALSGSRRPQPWALVGLIFGVVIIAAVIFITTILIYFKIRLQQFRSSYPGL